MTRGHLSAKERASTVRVPELAGRNAFDPHGRLPRPITAGSLLRVAAQQSPVPHVFCAFATILHVDIFLQGAMGSEGK